MPAPWMRGYVKPRQCHSKAETSFADKAPRKPMATFLQWPCTDVRAGPQRSLSAEEMDASELCWWRRLLSPLDCKEIQPVHPKGAQSWVFTGRTDAEAETPTLWPPHENSWLIGKDHDLHKD